MRLKRIKIRHFRSIEEIEVRFPDKKPVVLFGPNNVGKSNILKALDCLLGEKYTPYIDFQDSDYFQRDKDQFPKIYFEAEFDENIHTSREASTNTLCFATNHLHEVRRSETETENSFIFPNGNKMFLKQEERGRCEFILIDATRDIGRHLSYYSRYSILSRMSLKMHKALVDEKKDELKTHFDQLSDAFSSVPEYKGFMKQLNQSILSSLDGFEHKLEIDLSAYDPNNYFHSLRIVAKEGKSIRSFEEFGTGEQQILLMSFFRAFAEVFKNNRYILGIEEPEANLHPLAQKWLAKHVESMANDGLQIIITTHSPYFLRMSGVEGMVKITKETGLTHSRQLDRNELSDWFKSKGANPEKTKPETILPFLSSNTFNDQLSGFFARKVVLVEGPSEYLALPNYFSNAGYDLIKSGVEIINCQGKEQIARNYRLFTAYDIPCFCLFDADAKEDSDKRANSELGGLFEFDPSNMDHTDQNFTIDAKLKYGYFGGNLETYLKAIDPEYSKLEAQIEGGKPLRAKVMSERTDFNPPFVDLIAAALELEKPKAKAAPAPAPAPNDDDIPF